MSTLVGLRPYNRSAKVGVGSKDLAFGKTIWVNLENSRVVRDLARHTTLGQSTHAQPARFQLDTAQVAAGGVVTPRTGSLTLDISAGVLQYLNSDAVYTKNATANFAALTQAVTPSATLPQITAIGLNTSTPATPTAVALNGTAAATVLEARAINAYAGLPGNPAIDTTADRTWLALVWVPPSIATVTSVAATDVFTVGSAHGYVVGDPVWFSGLTGGAGLTANQVFFVNSVPSATTFTVSATLGGSTFDHTTNITAGTVQRQILAADVIDTRP
jgi:hypothetical protein